MKRIRAAAVVILLAGGSPFARADAGAAATPPRAVTVPVALDHNRMIVEVSFLRADGSPRQASAWVDTGSPDLVVAAPLARDLGLVLPDGLDAGASHPVACPSPAPRLHLVGLALAAEGVAVYVSPGPTVRPGVPAEANLPASALRGLHVVFDYPARRLTVARPGAVARRGIAVPCRVNEATGLFQVAATIAGETVALGIDNGSAGTWVADGLVRRWRELHPDWRHAVGAVGSANFFGFDFEAGGTLMRLPEVGLGALRVHDVAVLGLPEALFAWYSKKSAGTVAGFIGANVLRRFRVAVDYPERMTYWEASEVEGGDDLDIVGLTLRPEGDGGYAIVAVASSAGVPSVTGVAAGDRLLRVDGVEVKGAPMGAVVAALRGRPGALRTLIVERDGVRLRVDAKVTRFP